MLNRPGTKWVGRVLINAEELAVWARASGFDNLVPSAWHVTLGRAEPHQTDLTSKRLILPANRNRKITRMGGLIVLEFESPTLVRRHRTLIEFGDRWHYPRYRPHISFTPDDGRDLNAVGAFSGTLRLGPETFDP